MKTSITSGLAAIFLTSTAQAGPWVDPRPGHGWVELAYSRDDADEYFTAPNERAFVFSKQSTATGARQLVSVPGTSPGSPFPARFSGHAVDQSMQLAGEVALGRGFGFALSMPVVRNMQLGTSSAGTASNTGVGDLVLGVKYQIPLPARAGGFAFGPQVFVTTPTGDASGRFSVSPTGGLDSTGTSPGGNAPQLLGAALPTGNGTIDIETRLSAGYRFDPIPIFASADVGYHHHFDAAHCVAKAHDGIDAQSERVKYSDDLPYAVHIGGVWSPKLRGLDHASLSLDFTGVHSFENNDIAPTTSRYERFCGQNNNLSAFSLGATIAYYPMQHLGVTYSVSHVLSGVNVGYSLVNTVGVVVPF